MSTLLDFGFAAPTPKEFRHDRWWSITDDGYFVADAHQLLRRWEFHISRFAEDGIGVGYTVGGNKCPCGASDYHGGSGPEEHPPVHLPSRYQPGAVRWDAADRRLYFDLAMMAAHVRYVVRANYLRRKIETISLRAYRLDEDGGTFTTYVEGVLRPGERA